MCKSLVCGGLNKRSLTPTYRGTPPTECMILVIIFSASSAKGNKKGKKEKKAAPAQKGESQKALFPSRLENESGPGKGSSLRLPEPRMRCGPMKGCILYVKK